MRWLVIAVAVVAAAAAGLFAGYMRWGTQAQHTVRTQHRLESTESETATLRSENAQLEQQLEQVTKEQERLAQENDILRKQQTTERLQGGSGGPLPALPPK